MPGRFLRERVLTTGVLALVLTSAACAEDAFPFNPDQRVREPILLEGRSFRLFFDRHDPTFRVEDRQTSQSWHTALDRRGFASLLLPSPEGDLVEWPIDKMERLKVGSNAIRFRAVSSRGEIPEVDFEVAIGAPVESLRISFSTTDLFLEKGGAVKILDRLWMRDSESGGALIPVGLGEWIDLAEKTVLERSFGCSGPSHSDTPLLRGMGLRRGKSGMLMAWDDDDVEGRVRRTQANSESSPIGEAVWSLETTMILRGRARSLRLFFMGPGEQHDLFNNYRQLLLASGPLSTVRSKSRRVSGPPPFVGAALFRVPLGSSSFESFDDVGKLSESFHSRLGIDRACWIVENWLVSAADDSSAWTARVDRERGGEKGLVACATTLRDNAHILGLDFPIVAACEKFGTLEVHESIEGLQSILGQPLLMIRDDRSPKEREACGLPDCIDELSTRLEERFHLLGASRGGEDLFRRFSYLEGTVDPARGALSSSTFFPFVPAVVGRRARLGVSPERALRVGDADTVLDFLLLGEVPLFALPGAESHKLDDSASPVFSREDGGWFEGREISPHERFIKTSYEVLTHLARLRAREELHFYERKGDDGAVQELRYGFDLRIVLNRGERPYEDPDGRFVLPRYGFWIQHPFFFAFHATMANGVTYEKPALFTIRPLENKLWLRASKVRVWHAFGEPVVRLGGKRFEVEKGELLTKIW